MPFTPLHIGPSAAIALPLNKYLDVPVFLLVNIIIDIEPLLVMIFGFNYPLHGFIHTFIFAALMGILTALVVYLLRPLFQWTMDLLHFPYTPNFYKMLAAGVLGASLHIFLDGIYHWDIRPFFPILLNPLYGLITMDLLESVCFLCFLPAVIFYILGVVFFIQKKRKEERLVLESGNEEKINIITKKYQRRHDIGNILIVVGTFLILASNIIFAFYYVFILPHVFIFWRYYFMWFVSAIILVIHGVAILLIIFIFKKRTPKKISSIILFIFAHGLMIISAFGFFLLNALIALIFFIGSFLVFHSTIKKEKIESTFSENKT